MSSDTIYAEEDDSPHPAPPTKKEPSLLEQKFRILCAIPRKEPSLDIVRKILAGTIGTDDQRAAIIRIIQQNNTKKDRPILTLFAKLGISRFH